MCIASSLVDGIWVDRYVDFSVPVIDIDGWLRLVSLRLGYLLVLPVRGRILQFHGRHSLCRLFGEALLLPG